MASSYVNDLRLNELATGDASGTWGDVTNLNLELIGEALSFGTEAITTNADTHTTTVADGASDPGRAMYLKYTGTLDSACTITIAPNTISRMQFIENGTSGSQDIIISQGSGANVTIPAGDVKAVYLDGAGSGAAVVDAFTDLNLAGTTKMAGFTSSVASTITTADNTDTLSLISTDADANAGPNLRMYRNSGSPADDDFLGEVQFEGRNDNSEDVIYGQILTRIRDASDGAEDAQLTLKTMVAGTARNRLEFNEGEAVFNDDSVDVNFRVESDGNANMLFVDGGNNRVAIGNDSPSHLLDVRSSSTSADNFLTVGNSDNTKFLGLYGGTSSNALPTIYADSTSTALRFAFADDTVFNGFSEKMRLDSSGNLGLGTTSPAFTNGSGLEIERAGIATLRIEDTGSGGKPLEIFADDSTGYHINGLGSGMPMIFSTVNSERMRITSSGNVGINSTATNAKLEVVATSGEIFRADANNGAFRLVANQNEVFASVMRVTAGALSAPSYSFVGDTSTGMSRPTGSAINFVSGGTEVARFRSGGLSIGTGDALDANLTVFATHTNDNVGICSIRSQGDDESACALSVVKASASTSTSNILIKFGINNYNSGAGMITVSGATGAFGSFSDVRLKENIENLPSQLDSIMALRPVSFDYKEEEYGQKDQIGFVAQEVEEVYPDLVGENEGYKITSGINKMEARLIKAIQEQQEQIEQLKTQIETLQ